MTRFKAIAIAGLVAFAAPADADKWNDGINDRRLNYQDTTQLIHVLTSGFQRCFRLEKNYRYDCYDDSYFSGARRIRDNPAYAPAEEALAEVGRKIRAIVDENVDPDMPVLRQGFATYRPIRTSALPSSKERVAVAIEEAQTVLLRTPEQNGDNFARIASALESNKVLLRSALLLIGRLLRIA